MNILYILSVVYLVVMFLMYRKKTSKLCIISALVYTIALLFCYNTFIVYFLYLLGINGSILIFSIINYFIGSIILLIIYLKGKKIQKYYLDKKKLVLFIVMGLIIFLIGCFRFRGFKAISYETVDSAIHYRHAVEFADELSILDQNNSKDDVFGYFTRVMPISYINCGIIFNLFDGFRDYIIFSVYNVFCLMLSSWLFLVTIIDVFRYKKKDYIYALIFSLFYILGFPLNSFLFGFCYLSLGIMAINLLYLTAWHFKDEFDKNIIFKIIVITLITFSVFYSYYLFVPFIYLALGIYYIMLYRSKKIDFKTMGLYGVITLIIPFIIGFNYFLITWFQDAGSIGVVSDLINHPGPIYNNITPIYLYAFVTGYLGYLLVKNKKQDYLKLNMYTITSYIAIFLVLYIFKRADIYYFYKLFYIYWFFLLMFFAKKIASFKKIFYSVLVVLLVICMFVHCFSTNKVASFLAETNIFTWNARSFIDKRRVFNEKELEVVDKSMDYHDICVNNNHFLMVNNGIKRIWYYAITDTIPVVWPATGSVEILYDYVLPSFSIWEYVSNEYPCVVYYYENGEIDVDLEKYEILYENDIGAIIKRR